MATLTEIRSQYPEYGDMSDRALADALHAKFYSDMPKADFDKKIGLSAPSGKEAKDYQGVPETPEERIKNFREGVGRGMNESLYALGQMINKYAGTPESQAAFDTRMREALPPTDNAGGTYKAGQTIGGMISTAPLMAVPGMGAAGLAPRLAASAVGGGIAGTLSPEASTTDPNFTANKLTKGAIGAGLGVGVQGAASALGRVVSPLANRLLPEQQRLAQVFEKEIAPLTAAQATGSKPMQTVESVMEQLPGSSARQVAIKEAQQTAFTQAALEKAGIQAKEASPEVLKNARAAFSQEYNTLSANTNVVLDQQFQNDLQQVAQKYRMSLKADQAPVFDRKVAELSNLAQPRMGMQTAFDGETFQNIRTPLTQEIAAYKNSDAMLSKALKGLKDSLDQAEVRSLPPQAQAARADLDKRYAIFKTIENAMENSKATNGQISPVALFNESARRAKGGPWAEGKGELNDLARAGKEFLKPLPDSYTSQRAMITNLLTTGGLGTMGAGAGAAYSHGDPTWALAGAGAGMMGPMVAQRAMGNPAVQAWLRNQGGRAIPGLLGQFSPYAGLLAQ